MTTISIAIIGHNEAHLLPEALESVRWADEIVYVDCESGDGSLAVARRYTDRIFSHTNAGLIADKRTFSFAQATSEWVFYLDPDETVSTELAAEIRRVIASDPAENAFRLPRRNHYYGRWLRHGRQYPDTQLRLFRRGKAHFPPVVLHERLEVEGAVGRLREALDHHTGDTVLDSLNKLEFYTSIHAWDMAERGMRPSVRLALDYMLLKPGWRFLRRYVLAGGFLDGWPGFVVASLSGIEYQFRFLKFWHYATHGATAPAGAAREAGQAPSAAKAARKAGGRR